MSSGFVFLNRVLIAIDSLLRHFLQKKCRCNKNVLIIFQQLLGDAVLIQPSLAYYEKLYPKHAGYNVKFLAKPSTIKFMQMVIPIPNEITFETVDFNRFLIDYRYYREIVKKYYGWASTIIVPGTSASAEVFAVANNADRKIGLVREFDVKRPIFMVVFNRLAYTEKIRPQKGQMVLQRHRNLICHLGIDYVVKLPKLLSKSRIINDHGYCVVCPGASKSEKCWPIKRFVEITDFLIDKYNLTVHLCGGIDEDNFANEVIKSSRRKDRIITHIGRTTFAEWSAIIQYAKIVVGNDSATIHLAAAAHVPSVCIVGVYDKYQFFPYQVDELEPGERIPVTLLHDLPCEWCRTVGYESGYGNRDCKKRIEHGMCATCIDMITVDEVKVAIDSLLSGSD